MHKIMLLILLNVFAWGQQNSYPLEFTFDDEGYFVRSVLTETYRGPSFTLVDAKDNVLNILPSFKIHDKCNKVDMHALFTSTGIKDPQCTKFFHMFHSKVIKELYVNGYEIIVYENNNSKFNQNAIIGENGNPISEIGYISSNGDFTRFYSLLEGLKVNKKRGEVNFYIDSAKKSISKFQVNTALKNLVSAQMLDINNKEINNLIKKAFTLEQDMININLNSLH
jgi:hypothetical protein